MSSDSEVRPWFAICTRCDGNGLLRLWLCERDDSTCLLCDECEAIWHDVDQRLRNPNARSMHQYPNFPGRHDYAWHAASADEIEALGLHSCIAGHST